MRDLLLVALATATVTVTVTRSSVFQPLRVWIKARTTFIKQLISCTYCFSHWAAGALVWYFNRPETLQNFLLQWLVVVAIASPAIAMVMFSTKAIPPAFEDRTDDEE